MKLSDIKGERTLDVIADIIEPIANIASDKEAAALFKREKAPEGVDPKQWATDKLKKSAPKLIKNHKRDTIAILAAIEGSSCDEYTESLGLVKLTRDFISLLSDSAFIELFISAQSGEHSGSAQENTEAQTA